MAGSRHITRPHRRLFLSLCVATLLCNPARARTRSSLPDFAPEITAARDLAKRIGPLWLGAVIAAEDPAFRKHPGAASNITVRAARLLVAAASPDLSASARKTQALGTTLLLGTSASHDEILCIVLMHSDFGYGARGYDTAARAFFQRGAAELSLAQLAFLAGLIRQPINGPDDRPRVLARKDTVLNEMHALGLIDEAALQAALAEPLILPR